MLIRVIRKTFEGIQSQLDEYLMEVQTSANEAGQLVISENRNIRTSSLFLIVLVTIFGGLLAWYISRSISKPLGKISGAAAKIARGDIKQTIDYQSKDEIGNLAEAFRELIRALRNKAEVANEIARGNLAVEVKAISNEDVLGHAMVAMKDTLQAMQADLQGTIDAQKAGDLDNRCNPDKFQGAYAELLDGVNQALDAVIKPLSEGIGILDNYAQGDLSKKMRDLPGKQIMLTTGLNTIRTNLQDLIDEGVMVAKAAEAGRLKTRGDASKFEGGYREIIQGMNSTIDNILEPVNEALDCLAKMAKGDLTVNISGDYQGDQQAAPDSCFHVAEAERHCQRNMHQGESGHDQRHKLDGFDRRAGRGASPCHRNCANDTR